MAGMPWVPPSLPDLLLGASQRERVRASQTLLGIPALLLIQALLFVEWRGGQVGGATLAWFSGLTLGGCGVFYALVRWGHTERWSHEPSLSAPQMLYAMVCVAWGYALAGPLRPALLCLLPLILCFGIFALQPRPAQALSFFGIGLMGVVMAALAVLRPEAHPPLHEAVHWAFVATAMAMIQILAVRLGRMRARLSAQKAELSEALAQIRLLATHDVLTGLLNRRAAQDELRRAIGTSVRGARPLVVALADLDCFKLVNDSYGHQVGDRVLQAFARVAERELRGSDRVARWGGEEFLFLLPDTDAGQAAICLDRLRVAYAAEVVDGVPAGHGLSFSAGVAVCAGPDDIDGVVDRADQAMYQAKTAGRGRTCVPTPAPADAAPARVASRDAAAAVPA